MTERRSLGHFLWPVVLSAAIFLCFRLFRGVTAYTKLYTVFRKHADSIVERAYV